MVLITNYTTNSKVPKVLKVRKMPKVLNVPKVPKMHKVLRTNILLIYY